MAKTVSTGSRRVDRRSILFEHAIIVRAGGLYDFVYYWQIHVTLLAGDSCFCEGITGNGNKKSQKIMPPEFAANGNLGALENLCRKRLVESYYRLLSIL